MKRVWLAIAVLGVTSFAGPVGLAGCEGDPSAPNHTARDNRNLLGPTENSNAEKRELEKPGRSLPTGGGSEFPGQSAIKTVPPTVASTATPTADSPVQTLDASALAPFCKCPMHTAGYSKGPVVVPGTGMVIESNWGSVDALADYPHRAWPNMGTNYQSGDVKANPKYTQDLTTILFGHDNEQYEWGTGPANPLVDYLDVPWGFLNFAAIPARMFVDPPLAQRTTSTQWKRGVFQGHLPETGAIMPTPLPGVIHWEYPKATVYDGKSTTGATTQPDNDQH
jgi:hypothetical protein